MKNPILLLLVSCHRPEQTLPTMFLHHELAGGISKGGDCIVVTTLRKS